LAGALRRKAVLKRLQTLLERPFVGVVAVGLGRIVAFAPPLIRIVP
jgi:hypothetical protein